MMKKHDVKKTLNYSPNVERKLQNSPSSKIENFLSETQNLMVVKKFKIIGKKNEEENHDFQKLRRSHQSPFSSNIISKNLLISLKNKKLNQSSNSEESKCNISDDIVILPVIDKSSTSKTSHASHSKINTQLSSYQLINKAKTSNPIKKVVANENQQKLQDFSRKDPILISNNNLISSKISLFARDNISSLNKKQSRVLYNKNDSNHKFENNTVSPQKVRCSEIISDEIKVVNKVRKLFSESKITIIKPQKNYTVKFK